MTTETPARPPLRKNAPKNPWEAGLPDPRPVTGYTVAVSVSGGNTLVTIALDTPCVIRTPNWAFIDNNTGNRLYAASVAAVDPRTIVFTYPGLMPLSIGTIEVPYQDTQVQNFQGGFVKPGGQWFRKAS